MLNDHVIRSSLKIARRVWSNRRDIYEHAGPVATNPLLSEPGARFAKFCKDYSVHRTIRAGIQNEFRLTLIRMLPTMVRDDTGQSLDRLELRVRPRFGTHNGTRRMISVLSKVAASVRPERYAMYDQYARKGLNIIADRNPNRPFESYSDYLQAFDAAWNGDLGDQIRHYMRKNGAQSHIEREPRFLRSVLDMALMKCGGRKLS